MDAKGTKCLSLRPLAAAIQRVAVYETKLVSWPSNAAPLSLSLLLFPERDLWLEQHKHVGLVELLCCETQKALNEYFSLGTPCFRHF